MYVSLTADVMQWTGCMILSPSHYVTFIGFDFYSFIMCYYMTGKSNLLSLLSA